MSDNARKVWSIAKAYAIQDIIELYVDDLEAFAAGIDCDSDEMVIEALYNTVARKMAD